jgi:hypothetical protein
MSAIDKVLERFPYTDGAWRRRFVTGLVFVFVFTFYSVLAYGEYALTSFGDLKESGIKDVLQSTQLLLVVILVIFAIGSIIDAITPAFIVRGASICVGILNRLFDYVPQNDPRRKAWMCFTIVATFPFWPLAILGGTIASSAGFSPLNRLGLKTHGASFLSTDAVRVYEALPDNMKEGLDEPFGDRFDAAWRSLVEFAPVSLQQWINQIGARNYELASFLSSASIGMITSAFIYFPTLEGHSGGYYVWYAMLCLLAYLLFGCISITRSSVVSALELLAMAREKRRLRPLMGTRPSRAADHV